MQTLTIGNGTVSIEHDGTDYSPEDRAERQQYKYVIRAEGWEYVGNDIRSGVAADPDESSAMGSLLSFLGACAEARNYGSPDSDNWTLFPDHVANWAAEHSDDIEAASLEFSE